MKKFTRSLVVLFILLFGGILAMAKNLPREESNFIVQKQVHIEGNYVTREEVIQIFMFKTRTWEDNARISVILPPPDSVSFRQLAVEELGMSSQTYLESIKAKEYDGMITVTFAASEPFVVLKVANTPHSIGYYKNAIAINSGLNVRMLTIRE